MQAIKVMATNETHRVVDVQEFIDSQPLSMLQKLVLLLCFFVVAIDGLHTAIIGFILAWLFASEWGLEVGRAWDHYSRRASWA